MLVLNTCHLKLRFFLFSFKRSLKMCQFCKAVVRLIGHCRSGLINVCKAAAQPIGQCSFMGFAFFYGVCVQVCCHVLLQQN